MSADHDHDERASAMVSAGRRFGRRDDGSGERLSAEALSLTSGEARAFEEQIQVGLECDGPNGPMAPVASEDGQRPDGRSGERGRGEGPAGLGSGASATREWKRKLQEASGQLVGCLVKLDAQLKRGEGGERQELWAAGNGVRAVVNAQAAKATGSVAPMQGGPVGASAMAERPQQEGTVDGAGTTEVVDEGGAFGWSEGEGVGGARDAAAGLMVHGGLKKAKKAAEASAAVEAPMEGGAGAASGAAELGAEVKMENGGDEGTEVSKYMHEGGVERREGGGRQADEYYTH